MAFCEGEAPMPTRSSSRSKSQAEVSPGKRRKGGSLGGLPQDVFMDILTWVPLRELFRCMRVARDWRLMLHFPAEDLAPFEAPDVICTMVPAAAPVGPRRGGGSDREEGPRHRWKTRLRHPIWNEHYQRVVFLTRPSGAGTEAAASIAAKVSELVLSLPPPPPQDHELFFTDERIISTASVTSLLHRPLQLWQARLARLYDDFEAVLQTEQPGASSRPPALAVFAAYRLDLWSPFMSMMTESRFFLDLIAADPSDFVGITFWLASIFLKLDTWIACRKTLISDADEVAGMRENWNSPILSRLGSAIGALPREKKLYYKKFKKAADPVTEVMSHLDEAVVYASFSDLPGSRKAHKKLLASVSPNCPDRLRDLDRLTVYDFLTLLRDSPEFARRVKHGDIARHDLSYSS